MKIAVMSTRNDYLRKLHGILSLRGVSSECTYVSLTLTDGVLENGLDVLKDQNLLSPFQIYILSDLDNDRALASELAAHLECTCFTSCSDFSEANGSVEITRDVYGGLAHLHLSATQTPLIITLSEAFLQTRENGDGGDFGPDLVRLESAVHRIKVLSRNKVERTVDLASAKKIISVGRGLQKKEDIDIAKEVAEHLHAELGCSRPISEDYKWLAVERQVGLTGETVKPELYIAVGISGQVQHVVGMRDSRVVVAINNNKAAPIFESCDYGIVGDLYEVVPILSRKLSEKG